MNRRRVRSLLIGADDDATRLGYLGAVGVFVFGLSLWAVLCGINQVDATIPLALPWVVGGLGLVSNRPGDRLRLPQRWVDRVSGERDGRPDRAVPRADGIADDAT